MVRGLLVAALIIFVGNEWSERVRIKQEESILHRLPESEAVAYYEALKKRVRRTRLLRGCVLVALVLIVFSLKNILLKETPQR